MPAESVAEALAATRSEVERVCGLLVSPSPEVLDRCPGWLQRACSALANLRPGMTGARGDFVLLAEAQRLQFAVRHAARLLENVRDYHAQWNRILGAMTGGYTQSGDAAPVKRPGRVWVTG